MAGEHPRRPRRFVRGGGSEGTEQRFQFLDGNAARPEYERDLAGQVDDGRFDADAAWPAIEDGRNAAIELAQHVIGRGRADSPRAVGARGGDRATDRTQQFECQRVAGHAQRERIESGADQQRDRAVRCPAQHEAQRSRPEALHQQRGAAVDLRELLGLIRARKVHNQRVEMRSSLCRENRGDAFITGRVAAKPVNRLCRESDQLARAQQRRSLLERRCCEANRHGCLAFLLQDTARI